MPPKIQEIRSLVLQGDYARAEALVSEALGNGAPSAELLGLMGIIHAQTGRMADAARCFAEAQKLDPHNPEYVLHGANLAESAGDLALALAEHKRVLTLCIPRNIVGRSFAFPDFNLRGDEFPYVNPSFSLGGEDLILRKMFKEKLRLRQPGFYIDIGAASPVLGSNTYLFYCYGWRGVCIDANPRVVKSRRVRPRDIFVDCAVTSTPREVFFAEHSSSNAGRAQIRDTPDAFAADFLPPVRMRGRPLADILAESIPAGQAIDFMTIDVEGAEREVVESNDWKAYAPRVIVLEDETYIATRNSPAADYLLGVGYTIAGWVAPNVYFERAL